MPTETNGIHTSVLLGITVFELIIGVVAIFNSIYLINGFGDTVRNVTAHAHDLPVDGEILVNGIMSVAIVVPQAIILPTIVGIVAAAARSRCAYVAHLVFSFAAAVWSPLQTTVTLFYLLCYGFLYAQHLDDGNRHPREELLRVFFCFVGLFLISLVFCFVAFASSVASCCIVCNCCQRKLPAGRRCWVVHANASGDTAPLLQWSADDDDGGGGQGMLPPPYSIPVPGPTAECASRPAQTGTSAAASSGGGHAASSNSAAPEVQHLLLPPQPVQDVALIVLD